MKRMYRFITVLAGALTVMAFTMASAFAEGWGEVNFEGGVVTATGMGVAPPNAINPAQANVMARRAAVADAYRQLAETIKGVNVDAETTVENFITTSDVVNTKVSALIKGAQVVSEQPVPGGYQVTMQVSMYGVTSLASAVMPRPQVQEPFPAPVASVPPTPAASISVDVNIGGLPAPSVPSMPSVPAMPAPSAPTVQPSSAPGATGGYTGLVVDCRGLGLKPVMSPVVKNESGTPIYGHKNLDYDLVISKGMVSYSQDINSYARAGANPLIVKAVSLQNFNGNPVISTADANRVLIENQASGFLERLQVVFIR